MDRELEDIDQLGNLTKVREAFHSLQDFFLLLNPCFNIVMVVQM